MIDGKAISISLFSGAFGLDLGLELAGFHTVSVVEKDLCHPVELRPLTVRECARIQTFPDDWIFLF